MLLVLWIFFSTVNLLAVVRDRGGGGIGWYCGYPSLYLLAVVRDRGLYSSGGIGWYCGYPSLYLLALLRERREVCIAVVVLAGIEDSLLYFTA